MKTIGIIGAMDEEIAILKSKIEIISAKNIVGIDFYMGKLHGKNVVLVRSGIGKVNAAVCTQVLIDMYGVDCVINTGVAGAIHPELGIYDIVVAEDVVQHDFDVTGFGYELGVIPRMSTSYFQADKEMAELVINACAQAVPERKVVHGRIASGDVFVSDVSIKEHIKEVFNADCVEMEGAAIGHACFLNKIPFAVIRSMSDTASGPAEEEYKVSMDEAARQSGSIVELLVRDIN